MSTYVRKMALDSIFVKLDLEEVRQLIALLQRCSNNLNQCAKRANESGGVYAADIEDLQSRLGEIWELSRQSLARCQRQYPLNGIGFYSVAGGRGAVRALYITDVFLYRVIKGQLSITDSCSINRNGH